MIPRETEAGLSKRELLILFYKHRLSLLLAFAVPFAFAILIACLVTPRYKAESMLIVRLGAEYVYHPEVSDIQSGSSNIIPFNPSQIFKSEVAILNSDDLHDKIVHSFGVRVLFPELVSGFSYTFHKALNDVLTDMGILDKPSLEEVRRIRLAQAVELFDKRLDVSLDKDSAVIGITFENRDPLVAAHVLETLLTLYQDVRKTLYLEPRAKLAQSEMQTAQAQAVAAEQSMEDFKHQYKIHALEDERQELLQRRGAAQDQALMISSPALQEKIAVYNQRLDYIDSLERDFRLKQKEAQIAEDSYALYSHKYHEANALENLEHERSDSVRVIQKPTVPAEHGPVRLWVMLAGVFVSIMSVFTVMAFIRFFESSFHAAENVERVIQLPVLAVHRRTKKKSLENMRSLVHRLSHVTCEGQGKMITFISARSGEGTTHVAWDYAKTLAEDSARKVLLIDAGKFSLNAYRDYDCVPETGLVDKIAAGHDFSEAICRTSDGLSVCRFMVEGRHGQMRRMIADAALWESLKGVFDSIVVDVSSLQSSFSGIAFAAISDATVMVIEAEKTPHAVVAHLRDTLIAADAKIAGTFLNKYRHYIPQRVYKRL